MSDASITPGQCRAARALVSRSRDDIAQMAGINPRTVAALEAAENVPSRATEKRLVAVFEKLGVTLLPEGASGGVGVRLRAGNGASLRLVRRDPLRRHGSIGVIAVVDGRPITARIEVAALAEGGDMDAAIEAFDARRPAILAAVARKLADGALDDDGHLRVRAADLEPAAGDQP